MRRGGARQEAGRIGGLGACGRELCCASWISSFTSVTTGAARAQEISLNPQKLAGQCSKLKCCMMYEYDTYVDARKEFPRLRDPLQAMDGEYYLVKSDVLAGTMTFSSSKDAMVNVTTLPIARVREIMSMNRAGKKVEQLQNAADIRPAVEEPTYRSEEDSITRFDQAKRRNKRGRGRDRQNGGEQQGAERTEGSRQQGHPEQPQAQNGRQRNERPRNGENQNGNGERRERGNGERRSSNAERREGESRNTNGNRRGAAGNGDNNSNNGGERREGGNRNRNNRNRRQQNSDRPRGEGNGGNGNTNNGGAKE